MEDLKKHMELNEQAIHNSLENKDKLGALHFISNDMRYWKDLFTYNETRTALENFLLYKTAGQFDLHQPWANDADITAPVLKELKARLCALPCIDSVKVGVEIEANEKPRAFLVSLSDGRDLYLESDTGNTIMTDLGEFLRMILKKKQGQSWPYNTYVKDYYLDKKRLMKNGKLDEEYYNPFRFFYFYSLISKLTRELQDKEELACLVALEERAKVTYTLPNMIVVPYGYNQKRGFKLLTHTTNRKISDRLDLTFLDFEEMLADTAFGDAEFQARLCNKKCTVDSVRFLVENKEALFPPIPIYTPEAEYNDASAILERSRIITKTLSK